MPKMQILINPQVRSVVLFPQGESQEQEVPWRMWIAPSGQVFLEQTDHVLTPQLLALLGGWKTIDMFDDSYPFLGVQNLLFELISEFECLHHLVEALLPTNTFEHRCEHAKLMYASTDTSTQNVCKSLMAQGENHPSFSFDRQVIRELPYQVQGFVRVMQEERILN